MKYNKLNTPWTCDCDSTNFTKAGDTCVLTTDASSLTSIDSAISYALEVK